jgi:hypothetical protein
MYILNFLVRRRNRREVVRLASEVARRSRLAVWEQVYHQIGHLSVAEARGYIRAKSAESLHHEAQAVFERHQEWDASLRAELLAQAKDKIVHLIISDMLKLGRDHFATTRRAA